MKFSLRLLALFLSINSLIYQKEVKALTVTIQQTGADVSFDINGAIDLTGATFSDTNGNGLYDDNFFTRSRFRSAGSSPFIEIMGRDHIGAGDDFQGSGRNWEFSPNSIKVPVFGTGTGRISATSGYSVTGSGDMFRILSNNLVVPSTFSSGDVITGNMTFEDTTIADLLLTMGSVSYQLGNNTIEIVDYLDLHRYYILLLDIISFF